MKKPVVIDGTTEIVLTSWSEFLELTKTSFAIAPAFVYRGQANYSLPLRSTLDRLQERFPKRKNLGGNNPEFFDEAAPFTEKEHLNAFRRAIRGRRGSKPSPLSDEDEWWALGQHHGLATPLLDWTRSPFVALFFAFEEEKVEINGSLVEPDFRGVFALSTSTTQDSSKESDHSFA